MVHVALVLNFPSQDLNPASCPEGEVLKNDTQTFLAVTSTCDHASA